MLKNSLGLLLALLLLLQLFGCATGTLGSDFTPPQPPAPPLRSIQVTSGELTLPVGFSVQLTATGIYTDNSTRDLTSQVAWSSSAAPIGPVTSTGLATGVSAGNVTFTATMDGVSGSSGLTITSPTLTGLEIKPSSPALAVGTTRQVEALGHFSDLSDLDVTSQVTWSVTPGVLGTISAGGLLTASSAGNGTVSASLAGVTGTTPVTVSPSALVSVQINPATPTLSPGGQLPLTVTGTFADGSTQTDLVATWTSSHPAVATVDASGLLRGAGAGTSAITAQVGSVTAETTATVDALVGITVQPANATLAVEANLAYTVVGRFSNGSAQDLTRGVSWSSSDASVATISQTGVTTGVKVGSATITAQSSGVSGSAPLTVQDSSVVPSPPPDNPTYFQILIDNRLGSERTPHFSYVAGTLALNSATRLNSTWLTGGGPNNDDFTQPVMVVASTSSGGVIAGRPVPFVTTYDIMLDRLPFDPTGQYRVLKIPFLDPSNPQQSNAGSGRLYVTLDEPAVMQILAGGPGGFSIQQPSPAPNGAGSTTRFDFVELDCATAGVNNKSICFVDTSNVDFFSLGFLIQGRQADSALATFGLNLSGSRPVSSLLSALASLPGNFGNGTQRSGGKFTRFLAPGLSFPVQATDLDDAIAAGYDFHLQIPLSFQVGGTQYVATTVGDTLSFGAPTPFTIPRPSTLNVIAATGPLSPTGNRLIDDGKSFVTAYLNRGVFTNTSLWDDPSAFYPTGVSSNAYSALLHQRFLNGAVYGFTFDDVPAGIVMAPTITTCTSMTLVVDDE